MQTATKSPYISRVRKLLALASSPNENEAASAREKAMQLMSSHGITESDIADDVIEEIDTGIDYFREWMVKFVARLRGCKPVVKRGVVALKGPPGRVKIGKELYCKLVDEELCALPPIAPWFEDDARNIFRFYWWQAFSENIAERLPREEEKPKPAKRAKRPRRAEPAREASPEPSEPPEAQAERQASAERQEQAGQVKPSPDEEHEDKDDESGDESGDEPGDEPGDADEPGGDEDDEPPAAARPPDMVDAAYQEARVSASHIGRNIDLNWLQREAIKAGKASAQRVSLYGDRLALT